MNVQSLTDYVLGLLPSRRVNMSRAEVALAVHLRGNEPLYTALTSILTERLAGRASVAEPTDPLACKSIVARDREIGWLLSRLSTIYRSPVNSPATEHDDEPPA